MKNRDIKLRIALPDTWREHELAVQEQEVLVQQHDRRYRIAAKIHAAFTYHENGGVHIEWGGLDGIQFSLQTNNPAHAYHNPAPINEIVQIRLLYPKIHPPSKRSLISSDPDNWEFVILDSKGRVLQRLAQNEIQEVSRIIGWDLDAQDYQLSAPIALIPLPRFETFPSWESEADARKINREALRTYWDWITACRDIATQNRQNISWR